MDNEQKANYRGAVKNQEELQQDYEDFFQANSPMPPNLEKTKSNDFFEVEAPASEDQKKENDQEVI